MLLSHLDAAEGSQYLHHGLYLAVLMSLNEEACRAELLDVLLFHFGQYCAELIVWVLKKLVALKREEGWNLSEQIQLVSCLLDD